MSTIARSALVEHSASNLYALVEDIEAYPQFLPWCRGSRVLSREGGVTVAEVTVGLKGVRQSFTTRNTNRPGESISLELVEGPFSRFGAVWNFRPLGPRAARIEYSMTWEFSSRLLARVLEPLFEHVANSMVEAFIRRADHLHGPAAD